MKKIFLVLIVCLLTSITIGQNIAFELVLPEPPQTIADFEGVADGSIAFADIDNDNDQDVLITGKNVFQQPIAKLYSNDGNGSFFEVSETPFEGVFYSSIVFADVDNDNDQDVIITGENINEESVTKLYTNDGDGHFTEATGTPFDGVSWGSIAFADIDNDDDQDLLITGLNNTDEPIAKLYSNNGGGIFTLISGIPFTGVAYSSVAFADIDNDDDQDVLITGALVTTSYYISRLYMNDGDGNFTEIINTPFIGISSGTVSFTDIDNDNDQDVLIIGSEEGVSVGTAELYINDGYGSFTVASGTPFHAVTNGHHAFADIDNDNDQDVLITGHIPYNNIAILYTNDGSGTFTELEGTPFHGTTNGSIAFADIDNDNDQDVLITTLISTELYTNDGYGSFKWVNGPTFDQVINSAAAFADVDNDNDQDVIITGVSTYNGYISKLYSNNGNGIFSEVTETPFTGVGWSDLAFADIDNDNDQDVLIMGLFGGLYDFLAKQYRNDGNGNFTEVPDTPFEGAAEGTVTFADIDNDNDQDVLITGGANFAWGNANLYMNDGTGSFTLAIGTPFQAVVASHHAFADIDNDNDQDVIIIGLHSSESIAKLYTNNGDGIFSEVAGTPFTGVYSASVAFADIDNDNDQDVLITGNLTNLYKNDGSGNFTKVLNTPFEGVFFSSVAFADLDNDFDQDVIISGRTGSYPNYQLITKLYSNDGNGNFTEVPGTPFEGVGYGSTNFADIDNDNDQDVLFTGHNGTLPIARLYRNITTTTGSVDKITSLNSINLYPNPGTGIINLQYTIESAEFVTIGFYDVSGTKIKSLINEPKIPGEHKIKIDLSDLKPGIYFCVLKTSKGVQTKKIIKL